MEERRTEECLPAERRRAAREAMHGARASLCVKLDDPGAHDRHARLGADAHEQARDPLGQRDVVRVEPRNVPALRPVETAVQGRREPELLLVPEQDDPGIGSRCQKLRRSVGRRVVDDDELQVDRCLPEHALERQGDVALVVVDRQQYGHQGHGR